MPRTGSGTSVRAVRALAIVEGDLRVVERPVPTPEADQALVRVHGAGLNRADLLQRAGGYPAPPGVPADVPGMEFAGEVEAVGSEVRGVARGDRVFGIVGGGAQAEYVTVHASHCAAVPAGHDLVEMGGVPEVFITAHDAMVTQARVAAGEWVLVHAVGSGVGTAAVQLAHAFGAHVIGTARTAEKLDRCRPLGLDVGLVPPTKDAGALDVDALAWAIIEATGEGIHVALDLVGGTYVEADIAAAALKARIVCIGTVAGARASLPVVGLMAKRLHLIGTMLRARTIEEKAAATDAFVRDVVPLLADGRVAPVVHAILPLQRATEAYDLLASDATFGKVILDCR
jgi:putative PIG3 family NAD(P)H quinone oxidoreductase